MHRRPDPDPQIEHVILLALAALFLFASPLLLWWTAHSSPWYVPYLLWLIVILCAAWLHTRRKSHEP